MISSQGCGKCVESPRPSAFLGVHHLLELDVRSLSQLDLHPDQLEDAAECNRTLCSFEVFAILLGGLLWVVILVPRTDN